MHHVFGGLPLAACLLIAPLTPQRTERIAKSARPAETMGGKATYPKSMSCERGKADKESCNHSPHQVPLRIHFSQGFNEIIHSTDLISDRGVVICRKLTCVIRALCTSPQAN